jgi:hypothetical protein
MSSSVALAPAAVVAVDVGKTSAAVLVSDAERHRLLGPLVFPMTAAGLAEVINKTRAVLLLVWSGPGRSLPWTQPKGHTSMASYCTERGESPGCGSVPRWTGSTASPLATR